MYDRNICHSDQILKSQGCITVKQYIYTRKTPTFDHEDSEYALSFEIGQQESGFYSKRTDRQTESQSQPVPY